MVLTEVRSRARKKRTPGLASLYLMADKIPFTEGLFGENGPIAGSLAGYEVRPQQIEMVRAVEEAIESRKNLIVEAGTGVGKSLAYLAPFVRWAVSEGKRVVVSTYTKALQNQLFVKDLPFLDRVMDVKFRYAMCMGSDNYVCLRKAHRNASLEVFEKKKNRQQAEKIIGWISGTDTGLVTDMDFVPDRSVWSSFSRESDMCLGRKCPFEKDCLYRRARYAQSKAHVLVANHSLLFTELFSGVRVLPEFHGLVLDEAHTLEDVATAHLGREVSDTRVKYLVDDIIKALGGEDFKKGYGIRHEEEISEARERADQLRKRSEVFFAEAGKALGVQDGQTAFDREDLPRKDLAAPLAALSLALRKLGRVTGEPGFSEELAAQADRCDKLSESVDLIFGGESEKYVYWAEVSKKKTGSSYSFHAAPVDISGQMRRHLFDEISPVVLTSATLSSSKGRGAFSFIKERLGLLEPLELLLDSPFDYAKNVLMYMPRGVPDPNADLGGYRKRLKDEIIAIYDIMKGRIFALFTSYEMLNAVSAAIAEEREDINLLKQGDLPRYVLLDVFKKSGTSVLMGTTTFWQGVDVPGSSLECVIITRLPFAVPTDPVNAARIDAVREKGENPFSDFQLPQAVIMFKQGFGRLIRNRTDRGVVAVLDPRIKTRRYGAEFIKALPKCRHTDSIEKVSEFFEKN